MKGTEENREAGGINYHRINVTKNTLISDIPAVIRLSYMYLSIVAITHMVEFLTIRKTSGSSIQVRIAGTEESRREAHRYLD